MKTKQIVTSSRTFHWKWIVGAAIGVTVVGAGIVFTLLNQSQLKVMAIESAKTNPGILQRLGQPIEAGWFITGTLDVTPGSGKGTLTIPVSGPSGAGKLYAAGSQLGGTWQLTSLAFVQKGSSDRLDILSH
jgi:hypothetical protein